MGEEGLLEDPEGPAAPEEEGLETAAFSERTLAFCLDGGLFAAAYFASFRLAFPGYPLTLHPAMAAWPYLWAALFLLYQAFLSCEGRVSLGKRLLGLRVLLRDGQGLSLGQAAGRSLLYVLSGLPVGLGFFWSLFGRERQCWHDMVVGSVVVRERPLAGARQALVRLGAAACLLALSAAGLWAGVWGPRYHRIMMVAHAKVALHEMSLVQQSYRSMHGRYAAGLFELAEASVDPQGFLRDAASRLDLGSVAFESTEQGFTIAARARDEEGTLVRVSGPKND